MSFFLSFTLNAATVLAPLYPPCDAEQCLCGTKIMVRNGLSKGQSCKGLQQFNASNARLSPATRKLQPCPVPDYLRHSLALFLLQHTRCALVLGKFWTMLSSSTSFFCSVVKKKKHLTECDLCHLISCRRSPGSRACPCPPGTWNWLSSPTRSW